MFYTIESIKPICSKLHARGSRLVLATGFFDLLHTEHKKFLQSAKAVGDIVIVAIESDARARSVKGEGRPVETQLRRIQHIVDLGLADYCIKLDDDFNNQIAYESIMEAVKPNVYAISSHSNYQENKQQLAEKYGGKLVIVHDWNPNISTTKIIAQNKI